MIEVIGVDFYPDTDFRCAWRELPLELFRESFSRSKSRVKKFLPFTIFEARIPTNNALLLSPRQRLVKAVQKSSTNEDLGSSVRRKFVSHCRVDNLNGDGDGFVRVWLRFV